MWCGRRMAARSRSPVLWESWMGPNGEELETAVVITTEANKTLHPIHYRMPVVIPPEAFDFWLDCRNVDAEMAAALLVPAPEDLFEAYEISPRGQPRDQRLSGFAGAGAQGRAGGDGRGSGGCRAGR